MGKLNVLMNSAAKKIEQREIKRISKTASIIQGRPAQKGKVIGKVKIVSRKKELNGINDKILVTPMTSIRFTPFIKKVKAIVTDEGGIGCHAAIISRELKIPCVIGTKIATKVLKDGDKVEVDATKGIVKKI